MKTSLQDPIRQALIRAQDAQRVDRIAVSAAAYREATADASTVPQLIEVARTALEAGAPQSRANHRMVAKAVDRALSCALDLNPSPSEATTMAYLALRAQDLVVFDGTYAVQWSPLLALKLGIDALLADGLSR